MLKLAAGNDHLNVVQYEPLLERYQTSVLEGAVKYGSYKVVEFFVSNEKAIITQEMVDDAVKRGYYNLVKYYKESYGNLRPSMSSLELAAINEHFKTLELYPGCYKYLSQVALNSLAGSGDLNLITRLTKVDAQGRITNFSSDAIYFASKNGHLNIVNYFLVKRFSTDRSLHGKYLIFYGNPGPVEMVQNLLDYGAEITTESLRFLIEGGHYKAYEVILNHAMKNKDFQFDPRIMDIFNEHTGGNVEMVKSLFSHGVLEKEKFTKYSLYAARFGFLEILMFLNKNGVRLHEKCLREATIFENSGVVAFLKHKLMAQV